ncbi:hypothetical protein Sjap_003868 [Stephania japonica]|uniref:Uncharacterized protein n=1 Tax=Stephania japonica TaxID=461633 RepID=A0AAP0KPM7_9MAGN
MASCSTSAICPLKRLIKVSISPVFSSVSIPRNLQWKVHKGMSSPRRGVVCSAVQESSTSTATAETEAKPAKTEAPAKPKAPAKAPAKALPQLMEEDVIPSLKATLEAQDDLSEIELSFQDNRNLQERVIAAWLASLIRPNLKQSNLNRNDKLVLSILESITYHWHMPLAYALYRIES